MEISKGVKLFGIEPVVAENEASFGSKTSWFLGVCSEGKKGVFCLSQSSLSLFGGTTWLWANMCALKIIGIDSVLFLAQTNRYSSTRKTCHGGLKMLLKGRTNFGKKKVINSHRNPCLGSWRARDIEWEETISDAKNENPTKFWIGIVMHIFSTPPDRNARALRNLVLHLSGH